jgi:hypothetical protein
MAAGVRGREAVRGRGGRALSPAAARTEPGQAERSWWVSRRPDEGEARGRCEGVYLSTGVIRGGLLFVRACVCVRGCVRACVCVRVRATER